jgi:hypothetical protein
MEYAELCVSMSVATPFVRQNRASRRDRGALSAWPATAAVRVQAR